MINTLDKKRPTYTLVYFTAKWNPVIPNVERDYEATTRLYQQFTHIRVDCDATPQVKMYFDCRVEPQYLILLNGAELKRVVGFNFDSLHAALDQATKLHQNDFMYWGDTKDTWERFYDNFDRFARTGEYDKDAFRLFYEPIADMHRGPGTPNP